MRSVAVIVNVIGSSDPQEAIAQLVDADTNERLNLGSLSLMLRLEREPEATYARGQLIVLGTQETYPIQSSGLFFERLHSYLQNARGDSPPGAGNPEARC